MMEVDWNVLSKQWSDSHFRVGTTAVFEKKPGELWTAYRTVKPSFTVTKRGQGVLLLNEHPYDLRPGTAIYSGADVRLKAWNTGDEPFECYRVLYEAASFEPGDAKPAYAHYRLEIGENPHMYALLDQMCEVSKLSDVQSEFQLQALFYQFLNEMRISSNKTQENEHRAIIEESISYIHLHIHEPHSLFGLAGRYGLSPKYFSELFFKVAGYSPINYIIRHRVNQAEKLLLTTNAPIREIGRSVGYRDPYQFSKIFKKYRGIAPSAYRSGNRTERNQGGPTEIITSKIR